MTIAPHQPIGLVLADPHPVMLDGLQKDLQEWPEFQIHSCARDGDSALKAIHEHHTHQLHVPVIFQYRSNPFGNGFVLV